MSCFDNLFKMKKGELNKIVKGLDKSILVSKLKKADLLCMYLQLTNNTLPPKSVEIPKALKSALKSDDKPKPKKNVLIDEDYMPPPKIKPSIKELREKERKYLEDLLTTIEPKLTKPQEKELEKIIKIYEETKPAPKPAPKPEPKPAPKPEPKLESKPSESIDKILNKPDIIDIIKSSNSMINPLTGEGKIIEFATTTNKKLKVVGIEIDKKQTEHTKELFSKNKNVEIIQGDFLNGNFNNNDFDLIIMKTATNQGDKEYYFKFIFKVLRLMRQGRVAYRGDTVNFILICPKMKISDGFGLGELISENKSLSFDTFSTIYFALTGDFISPREFKELPPRIEQKLGSIFDVDLDGSLIGTSGNLGIYLIRTG